MRRRTHTVLDVLRKTQEAMLAKTRSRAQERARDDSPPDDTAPDARDADDSEPVGDEPSEGDRLDGRRGRRRRGRDYEPVPQVKPTSAARAKLRAVGDSGEGRRRVATRLGKYWAGSIAVPRLAVLIVALSGLLLFAAGYGTAVALAGPGQPAPEDPTLRIGDSGPRNTTAGPTVKDPGIVPAARSESNGERLSGGDPKRETAQGVDPQSGGAAVSKQEPKVETQEPKAPEMPSHFVCIVQLENNQTNRTRLEALIEHIRGQGLFAKLFFANRAETMLGVYVGVPNPDEKEQFLERLYRLEPPPRRKVTFDFAGLRNVNLRIRKYNGPK